MDPIMLKLWTMDQDNQLTYYKMTKTTREEETLIAAKTQKPKMTKGHKPTQPNLAPSQSLMKNLGLI